MGKSEELHAMTKARSKKKGIPFTVALTDISREQPDLVLSAREEVVGSKLEVLTARYAERNWNITTGDLGQRLADMAHTRSEEKGISLRAALSEIGRENSDLVRRAREETLGTKL